MSPNLNFCDKLQDIYIQTKTLGKICKYHKRARQIYCSNQIITDFCPAAFYMAYPFCLALLYNGKFTSNIIQLSCPKKNGIIFNLERIRPWQLLVAFGLKFLKLVTEKISFPLDIEDWHIRLTVVENKCGCPQNYQLGKTYEFNIRRLEELCPASFYQLYPFIFSSNFEQELHCPDHQGMTYLIKEKN